MLYVYMSLGYCFIPPPPIIRAAAEALCIRPFYSSVRACIRATGVPGGGIRRPVCRQLLILKQINDRLGLLDMCFVLILLNILV